MNKEELEAIQELVVRKIQMAEVMGGLTSSDKKFIDLYNYAIDLEDKVNQLETNINDAMELLRSNNIEVLKYYDEPSETGSYEIVTVEMLSTLERGKE